MNNNIFINLSTVYQNLRGIIDVLAQDANATLAVTIGTEEIYDEGICIVDGVDRFLKRYNITDYEVTEGDDMYIERVTFTFYGIKFCGFRPVKREEKAR